VGDYNKRPLQETNTKASATNGENIKYLRKASSGQQSVKEEWYPEPKMNKISLFREILLI